MLIVFLIIVFLNCLLFAENDSAVLAPQEKNISQDIIYDFDSIYAMQKNINTLKDALYSCLSTLLYAKENLPSEDETDRLLKRIYKKIELATQYSAGDEIFQAIIGENTERLIDAVSELKEATTTYQNSYEIADFIIPDFQDSIVHYRFEDFRRYLELNKLLGLNLVEKLSGDQLKVLTNHLINTIKINKYYFGNDLYRQLVEFGGEKFINYLSIQITPYIDMSDEASYKEQLSLLNTYINIYQIYYKSDFENNIPKQNYNYYLSLSNYFEYLENVEILSKRFITSEATTLSSLSDIFLGYLNQYNSMQIKTGNLDEKIQNMIKNASTRLVYADQQIKSKYHDAKKLSLKNQELQDTLNNFNETLNVDISNEMEKEEKDGLLLKIQNYFTDYNFNPFIIIPLLIIVFIIIYLMLPLKTKGVFLKRIGLTGKALSLLQKASIQKPMDADIHIKTAQLYEKMGRDEDAINEYKIASKVIDMKGE
jgi:hypothetical protein